jgi:NAD(P)-dependent dehydrogenase (short-subunit alcohol dehydrogenase family)
MSQVWLVAGAGRGLGRAIAQAALNAGHYVVATARNTRSLDAAFGDVPADRLLRATLDVSDLGEAHQVTQAAIGVFGRVDVLVNNAGYGQLSAFEETTPEEVRAQLDIEPVRPDECDPRGAAHHAHTTGRAAPLDRLCACVD